MVAINGMSGLHFSVWVLQINNIVLRMKTNIEFRGNI